MANWKDHFISQANQTTLAKLIEELALVNQGIGQQSGYTVEMLQLYQEANGLLGRINRLLREATVV